MLQFRHNWGLAIVLFHKLFWLVAGSLLTPQQIALASKKEEIYLQEEISQLFDGRIERKYYLAFAKVKSSTDNSSNAQDDSKPGGLPFAPTGINRNFFTQALKKLQGSEEPSIEDLSFTIGVIFDDSIPDTTIKALDSALRKKFSIDGQTRYLEVTKTKIFVEKLPPKDPEKKNNSENEQNPSPSTSPSPSPDTQLTQKISQLEDEKIKAMLESERTRLELTKKEFEFLQNQAKLTEQIKQKSEAAKNEEAKLQKQLDELTKNLNQPQISTYFRDFQVIIIGVLLTLATIVGIRFAGSAFKVGLGIMAESIKTSVNTVTESLSRNSDKEVKIDTVRPIDEATTSQIPPPPEDKNWSSGTAEFESYVAQIQDKIEVLTRERNFNFLRHLTDMTDDETTLPLAAAVLVALPNELSQILIQDISTQQIRKIHSFLESHGGLASAKSLRRKALQEFYGRIAIDEFSSSPLIQVKNLNWLTRLTSEQIADFVVRLPEKYRSALLSCFSAQRTRKILNASKTREARESIIAALTHIGKVTAESFNEFLEYAKTTPEAGKSVTQRSMVDEVHHLAALVGDMDVDDQNFLSKVLANDPNLQAKISSYYFPFNSIIRVPKEWITQILEPRSNQMIAMILFASDQKIRSYILAAMPGIKSDAIQDELKSLDDNTIYAQRNRKQSEKFQKEICKQILGLINTGTLELKPEEGYAQPKLSAATNNAA